MTDLRAPRLARIWRMTTGFPGAHAFNAGLSILFTLTQTLVFARVLDARTYAQIVAAGTIGLYFLPINQAVARANFILLRAHTVRGGALAAGAPEAAAAFTLSQSILTLVSLVAPFTLGAHGAAVWLMLAAYIFTTVFSNIWYSELQMTMLAAEHAMRFEMISLLRRLLGYATLAWLWFTRDFFSFSLVIAAQTLAFHLFILATAGRETRLFSCRGVTAPGLTAHAWRLWTSLQATFAEWLTLNSPYMIFTARFGIGPGLVAVDALMKLLRMVVSVTRNLCEIALPRVSRAVFSGHHREARLPTVGALAGGLCAAGVLALALVLFPDKVFGLLLGHNNTVPRGAGLPSALALLAGSTFAVGAHLVGHTGAASAIRTILAAAALGTLAFAAVVFLLQPHVLAAMWMFTASFLAISATTAFVLARMLRTPAAAA